MKRTKNVDYFNGQINILDLINIFMVNLSNYIIFLILVV